MDLDALSKMFLDSNGKVSARKLASRRVPDQVFSATSFLDHLDPSPAQRLRAVFQGLTTPGICRVCGGPVPFSSSSGPLFKRFCSRSCAARGADRKETDHALRTEKTRRTNLERYGVACPANIGLRDRIVDRYGVENVSQLPWVREKISASRKSRPRIEKRYGVTEASVGKGWLWRDAEWLRAELETMSCAELARRLDVSASTIYNAARAHGLDYHRSGSCQISSQHRRIIDLLDRLGIEHVVNDRKMIGPREIDVLVPGHRLGIEINGTYWHSDAFHRPDSHLRKLELCRDVGIDLIQLWDTEIDNKWDLVESVIVSRLGMSRKTGARTLGITRPSNRETRSFLETSHFSSWCPSSIRYGLEDASGLVAIMTFGKSRFDKGRDLELLRFCSRPGTQVQGGFRRLWSAFRNDHPDPSVVSFCNRRLFSGRSYERIGMELIDETPPNQFWLIGDEVLSRHAVQKHKLSGILKRFDPGKSAASNLYDNGFLRIWDCGSLKFYG